MYEDLKCKQLIEELKSLIEKAESSQAENDVYCELMKTMILNTYSTN